MNITELLKIFPNIIDSYNESDPHEEVTTPEHSKELQQSQNITEEELKDDEDRRKLMIILGRVIEICLLFLIIVTSVLCFILMCSIKFC